MEAEVLDLHFDLLVPVIEAHFHWNRALEGKMAPMNARDCPPFCVLGASAEVM